MIIEVVHAQRKTRLSAIWTDRMRMRGVLCNQPDAFFAGNTAVNVSIWTHNTTGSVRTVRPIDVRKKNMLQPEHCHTPPSVAVLARIPQTSGNW